MKAEFDKNVKLAQYIILSADIAVNIFRYMVSLSETSEIYSKCEIGVSKCTKKNFVRLNKEQSS